MGGGIRLSTPHFPKAKEAYKAQQEAYVYIFEKLTDFEKRIKALEKGEEK